MACLALSLQPLNGPDVLLQTREWFPPARAALASQSFRTTRGSPAHGKSDLTDQQPLGLGNDPVSAASGQVVVGKESKYRVVYRLVNAIYVLGITTADQDVSSNVFECTSTVNQAVSVLVAACKGIDVTSDKLLRKYTEVSLQEWFLSYKWFTGYPAIVELFNDTLHRWSDGLFAKWFENKIRDSLPQDFGPSKQFVDQAKRWLLFLKVYMALDVVLRGVSAARLATILASLHGEGISQIVVSATDAENRARGAESWNQIKGQSIERVNHIEVLSNATFELPEETLAAGDEASARLATPAQTTATVGANVAEKQEEKPPVNEDPFAASDAINKPEELLTGGFKKDKEVSKDVTAGLSELKVSTDSMQTTQVKGVEGFEGDYGGLDYDPADGGFGDAFEGLTDAFGGGLDPSEFGATTEKQKRLDAGLGGLEELEGGGGKKGAPETAEKNVDSSGDAKPVEANGAPGSGPMLWLTEEISAEFDGVALSRVGLRGLVQLRTMPPAASKDDTEFSFGLEGAASIKNTVVSSNVASSLGEGVYHVRTPPSDSPITILRYRLQPQFTPLPLQLRLVSRQNPLTLSFMIQYVPNPYLRGILTDVVFIVSLPFVPSTLKMSPRGILDRNSRELRWVVPQLLPQAIPQRLRVQLPLAPEFVTSLSSQENGQHSKAKEIKVKLRVEFSCRGQSLSGISLVPASKDSLPQFSVGEHVFKARKFLCS